MRNAIDTVVNELRSQLGALGPVFNADVLAATRAICRSHLDLSPASREATDIAYGEAARWNIDSSADRT
jgi:hypothetical protein